MSYNRRSSNVKITEAARLFGLDGHDVERFWAKVNRNGPIPADRPELGPCWLWTSATGHGRTGQEYGLFSFQPPTGKRKNVGAHRVAWALSHGPIPPNSEICHHCDTGICVRDEHLYRGDRQTNSDDAVERGRYHSPRPRRHKVTSEQLLEVDALLASGAKHIDIAQRFGVSEGWVSQYINGTRRLYDRPQPEQLRKVG